ncbi:MAG: phenylalanine--tRNA ligase subunit beta [Candidatus Marinimicrobia bacterium]|nr:phenylalanine--tRNA ligase subunit beta [Candidatus Neomarinimicrobiota bacterium]MBL7010082.1 phenylalanine--tRNA ligase subunit beta [Candidatus Neomarinimicrobiota bacterium]MBL7030007.1 phenylalanine--tRNA ligase subunit beta [Candidatus Neomarinimicrobiota bacterium]
MRISIDWLKEFVDVPASTQEVADILTMLGLEAENGLNTTQLTDIIIGEIKSRIKHPNADKLSLCQVFDGESMLPVVCGAPNVEAGQKIAFAPVGSVLPGDFKIGKAKIRGEVSKGMICSESELGISEEHDGIMILKNTAKVGSSFIEYFQDNSASIELDITPNRPDCFSHVGVARDISVKMSAQLKSPDTKARKFKNNEVGDWISVEFENVDECPRYVAGVVKNVKVGQSPDWLKNRLESIGQRSINNIVDISNFVMMEMGHPTHMFDYDKFGSKTVLIRRGKKGEKITTLDEIERNISSEQLLITNGKIPVAIAGIMGGLESAVSEETTTVLIESAYFDAPTIRKGAKSVGMITDASKRFERGADTNGAENAFWRVVQLLEEVAGGSWVPGVADPYPKKIDQTSIELTREKLDLLSGCEIDDSFVVNTLKGLGCIIKGKSKKWISTPPSWRPDLVREVDLIEEVIRFYGFDNVPSKYHYNGVMDAHNPDPHKGITLMTSVLTGLGFTQLFNNSLQSNRKVSLLDIPSVKIMNPLSDKMDQLRTSLIQGLLETADFNAKNGSPDLMLFEWGNVFEQEKPGLEGIVEKFQISGLIHGTLHKVSVHRPKERRASFFTLKGLIESFLSRIKIHNVVFNPDSENDYGFQNAYTVEARGDIIGYFGDISHKFVTGMNLDLGQSFGFQFDLNKLLPLSDNKVKYQSIINFPIMERDLNFVINENTEVGDVVSIIQKNGKTILKKVKPYNIFRDESVGENIKAVAINLQFQSNTKTLEDKDVNSVINEIIRVVSKKFSAKLR